MRVANQQARPLLVYDGDCGFCRTWVARWRRAVGERIAYEPFQTAAPRFPAIPRRQFRAAVHLIMPDGDVFRGAEAVLRSLALAPDRALFRWWLIVYATVPGARPVAEWAYRWIADHRPILSRLTHYWMGPPPPDVAAGGGGAAGAEPGGHAATYEAGMAAARRRRVAAAAAGLGAVVLLGGWAGWRLRHRLPGGRRRGRQSAAPAGRGRGDAAPAGGGGKRRLRS
jgi:predicted DCC family thiol-disulfide oxidoreductase YuxK